MRVFCFLLQFVGPHLHFPPFAVCGNLFNPRLFKKFPKTTDFIQKTTDFIQKTTVDLKKNIFQRTTDFKKQQISKNNRLKKEQISKLSEIPTSAYSSKTFSSLFF